MTNLVLPPGVHDLPGERCGNCWYGVPQAADLSVVLCEGSPPTVILTADGRTLLSRPTVPKAMRRCALWRRQEFDA